MQLPIFTQSALADALFGWPPPILDPAGPYAGPVALLAWVLFIGGALILLIVLAAIAFALFGGTVARRRLANNRAILIGGFAFPVVTLSILLVWGLTMTRSLSAEPGEGAMHVRVTGEMWWWRVDYLDDESRLTLTDANELHIPVGVPVSIELRSADVIHSFWVPRLSGKTDMIPGRSNVMHIQADAPGVYGGQCAEYCGGPHALMGFVVVAHAPADFSRWLESRKTPPPPPSDEMARRGADLFLSSGCGGCHVVRGTEANGIAGPDLTHIGARQSLGAGILPNNRGTLAGWVADSQAIKPGNRMPTYKMLSGEELQAISAYLEQLK